MPRSFHSLQRISGPFFKMTEKELKRIDYQFVPVPTELVFALDPYCLKAIAIMIDKESYWKSRSKVFNGYFTLSVEELAEYLCLENRKDARLTLEALYRAGLIDIKVEVGKRFGAKVKLNWNEMKKERLEAIEKLQRTEKITYCTDGEGTTIGTTEGTNCTATLEQEIEKEIDIEQEIEKEQFCSSVISPEEYQEIYSNPILREVQFTMDDVEKARDIPYEETNPFILDYERRYDT